MVISTFLSFDYRLCGVVDNSAALHCNLLGFDFLLWKKKLVKLSLLPPPFLFSYVCYRNLELP